jgi:hypothetical protein
MTDDSLALMLLQADIEAELAPFLGGPMAIDPEPWEPARPADTMTPSRLERIGMSHIERYGARLTRAEVAHATTMVRLAVESMRAELRGTRGRT